MRLCFIAAKPYSVEMFLISRIKYAISAGYDVVVITSLDDSLKRYLESIGVKYISINIERRFSPINDFISLCKLIFSLSKLNVDIVHTISSKGGLLGALASKIIGIKYRFHIYAGLPWVEMSGAKRIIGRMCDRLIANIDNMTYADSPSERDLLIEQGICKEKDIRVLGQGSVSGFNISRFCMPGLRVEGERALQELGIFNKRVILFLGRVTADKGVCELVESFVMVSKCIKDVCLVIAGPLEEEIDPLPSHITEIILNNKMIYHVGFQRKPEIWYSIAEFLVLPSYREGFGNVVIEAAAAGIPTLGTNIVGLKDSIIDQETGLLVEKKNVAHLTEAMKTLLQDTELKNKLGSNAKRRALNDFSEEFVNKLILDEYDDLVC